MKTHFHMKGCAPSLALIGRQFRNGLSALGTSLKTYHLASKVCSWIVVSWPNTIKTVKLAANGNLAETNKQTDSHSSRNCR